MRLATFTFGSASECAISAFPGDTGGLVPNVNRWRQQLGLEPLSDAEVAESPVTPMLGRMATLVRAEGTLEVDGSPRASLLLGAVCMLGEESVFVKLTGPTAEVDAASGAFLALCRSIR